MYPTIETVLARRYLIGIVLRVAAIVLFLFGAAPIVEMVFMGVAGSVEAAFRQGFGRAPSWVELILITLPASLKYVLPGVVLLMFQQGIVRWIAPLPRPRCPECGYWIRTGGSAKCPECGSPLPQALVERGDTDSE